MPPPRPAKKSDDSPAIKATIDGTDYVVRPDEVSAQLMGEIRNTCGRTFASVMGDLSADRPEDSTFDYDTLAILAFVATRQAGDTRTSYASIAKTITYGSTVEVGQVEQVEADPGEVLAVD